MGVGDDYDFDRPSRRGHVNQLEDIRDWNSGNKSIAEEAIDKFKEIVGRVKFFDTASDYPYVKSSVVTMFSCLFFHSRFCCVAVVFRYDIHSLSFTVYITMVGAYCLQSESSAILSRGMLS